MTKLNRLQEREEVQRNVRREQRLLSAAASTAGAPSLVGLGNLQSGRYCLQSNVLRLGQPRSVRALRGVRQIGALAMVLFVFVLSLGGRFQLAAQDAADAATVTNNVAATNKPDATVLEDAVNPAAEADTNENDGMFRRRGRGHISHDGVVTVGSDAVLKAGESADAVVAVGGSAIANGKVHDAVVAIGGDAIVTGEVGDAVVAVLGNVKIKKGAIVRGDVVSVGGRVEVDPDATVEGHTEQVDFGQMFGTSPEWFTKWFKYCVLRLRPLAPQVGWVWVVAGMFFLFYLLIAVLFPRPVQACVNELTSRPATTFLMGLLTKILFPLVLLILIATGIGLIVVPFLIAALWIGAIVGKVALLESLGMRVMSQMGSKTPHKAVPALFIGSAIICVLYMVPVLGLVTFGVISLWGLGAAVTAAFGGMRRELPPKTPPAPATTVTPTPPAPATSSAFAAGTNPGFETTNPGGGSVGGELTVAAPEPAPTVGAGAATTATAPPTPAATPASALPDVLTYPKAGFWERMAAAFLDIILVGILGAMVHGPPFMFLVALGYFAGMWAWKGTTVGGIVLGLKVVRTDGRSLDFAAAIVRALAAAFSIIVFFLGILWIAWDKDKQGWHDRIAGTVVLKLPKGTPLVML